MRSVQRSSELITGWGRAVSSRSTVIAADPDQIPGVVAAAGQRGSIARGLGRSYGDPALNSGGDVIRVRSAPIDPQAPPIRLTGHDTVPRVVVNAGVSIAQLIEFLVPRGYFVPVTPGTRLVTVGGAIASDIHGKNHHLDGSFGDHVLDVTMVLANGEVVTVGPEQQPELFWATVGGMGLTGIVTQATVAVLPIETSRIVVESRRVGNLDDMMAAMIESDQRYRYSVAWIDVLARGRSLGRGVLTDGHHAAISDLSATDRRAPLAYHANQRATFPALVPRGGVINRVSVAAFNEAWYRRAPSRNTRTIESIPTYFHPLDAVGGWNRVYGRSGFLQYQVVVPLEAAHVIGVIIEQLATHRLPSFLSVLKRFGPGNGAMLGFPMPGWTLAVDLSTRAPQLASVLRTLDEVVINAGGRHYLAKDHLLTPEQLRRSYPRLPEWRRVREHVDPDGVWQSDQSRRLHLSGHSSANTSRNIALEHAANCKTANSKTVSATRRMSGDQT